MFYEGIALAVKLIVAGMVLFAVMCIIVILQEARPDGVKCWKCGKRQRLAICADCMDTNAVKHG